MITITKDAELRVVQVEGSTENDIFFIDGYLPSSGELTAVDSGRIIIGDSDVEEFTAAAAKCGLTVGG